MNVDLMDKQGCQIQSTFFGDCVHEYNNMLQEGKVYIMSNGQVKMANKRFTTIPNDHSITFDHFAKITECNAGGSKIKGGGYNFTSLKKI